MRIAIIGTEGVGDVLAAAWTNSGHQIVVGDARDRTRADALAERIGDSVRAAAGVDEAARSAEVIVLAGAFQSLELLPSPSTTAGKVLVDAMNQVPDSEPRGTDDRPSSVIVAERFTDAAVVKAFNTIDPDELRDSARPGIPRDRRFAIFLAGDNARANARVATLIEEIGYTPVDTGSLRHGGALQRPGSAIFGRMLLPAEARRVLALSR